ncbi:MAG: MCE family protein [Candidatus Schekmanbacteria bacterium]|nr:MAG: MCE family protein [Candidatus Schekmanbacteria bacterium]
MNNKKISVEAKVGLFTLAVIILLFWLSMQFGEITWLKPKGYVLHSELENVAGLEKESPIKMAGVRIGRIEDLRIEDGKAKLAMRIDDGVQIHEGAKVSVKSDSLLGQKYLDISFGDPKAKLLADGDSLGEGVVAADIDKLIGQLTEVAKGLNEVVSQNSENINQMLANLKKSTDTLQKILTENEDRISSAIANIDGFSKKLNTLLSENKESVTKAISNFEKFSSSLNEKGPEVMDKFSKLGDNLDGMIEENRENLKETILKVKETSDNLNKILVKVNKGEGTLGKLVNDDELYDTAKKSLKDLGDSAEQASELSPISTFISSLFFLF